MVAGGARGSVRTTLNPGRVDRGGLLGRLWGTAIGDLRNILPTSSDLADPFSAVSRLPSRRLPQVLRSAHQHRSPAPLFPLNCAADTRRVLFPENRARMFTRLEEFPGGGDVPMPGCGRRLTVTSSLTDDGATGDPAAAVPTP